jgi:hypothetical protein
MRQLFKRSSKLSNYTEKVHRDVTVVQLLTRVTDSSRCEENNIQPTAASKRTYSSSKD